MHSLVRIVLREDLNLVFDKWHIMFTDRLETAELNTFSKTPVQVIISKLLFLLQIMNLLNEKYREGSKVWRVALKRNKDFQILVKVRNNPFKVFCPLLLLSLNLLVIRGRDLMEESGLVGLMLKRSPFSRRLWIYLSKLLF